MALKLNFTDKIFFIKRINKSIAFYNKEKQALTRFLIAGLVLITVLKLSLIGKGFFTFPDELRYTASGKALESLSQFDLITAIRYIFSTQGRPVDGILKTIPNALQFISAHIFHLKYYESSNSYPLFIYNFAVYCLILIVHFKFSAFIFKDRFLAVVSTLLFAALTNSYIYLRHALPYDESLLIFYIVIYKIVTNAEENRMTFMKSFYFGFLSFLGYLAYPGYFPLLLVSLFLLFFYKLTGTLFVKKMFQAVLYVLGSVFCLIVFESISRLVGRSYIGDAIGLSKTINQGSFEESFSFILKYFFEVEWLNGMILFFGVTAFCLIMISKLRNKTAGQDPLMMLLGIAVIGVFLIYASAGYFFHKMVFYGRLLHQYFPFICIFSLFAFNTLLAKTKRPEIYLGIVSVFFILNFAAGFFYYRSFSYPRDIAWELSKMKELKAVENFSEYDDGSREISLDNENKLQDTTKKYPVVLVTNCTSPFVHLIDETKYHKFTPGSNYDLIKIIPHFINLKSYQYEGYNIEERRLADKINLDIKLFSKRKVTQ